MKIKIPCEGNEQGSNLEMEGSSPGITECNPPESNLEFECRYSLPDNSERKESNLVIIYFTDDEPFLDDLRLMRNNY